MLASQKEFFCAGVIGSQIGLAALRPFPFTITYPCVALRCATGDENKI